ncbi:uncharacterized protein V6R79_003898 [Siganus canaliculatus]
MHPPPTILKSLNIETVCAVLEARLDVARPFDCFQGYFRLVTWMLVKTGVDVQKDFSTELRSFVRSSVSKTLQAAFLSTKTNPHVETKPQRESRLTLFTLNDSLGFQSSH